MVRPTRRLFRLRLTAALVCVFGSSLPTGTAKAFSITEPGNLLDAFYTDRPVDYLVPEIVTLGVNQASNGQGCINFGCSDPFDSFRFIVPAGLQITLTEFVITGAPAPPEPFGAALVVEPHDPINVLDPPNDPSFFPDLTILAAALVGINSNTLNQVFQSTAVYGPGIYDVVFLNGGHQTGQAFFHASAIVPEPGGTILLALVFSALWWRRREASTPPGLRGY